LTPEGKKRGTAHSRFLLRREKNLSWRTVRYYSGEKGKEEKRSSAEGGRKNFEGGKKGEGPLAKPFRPGKERRKKTTSRLICRKRGRESKSSLSNEGRRKKKREEFGKESGPRCSLRRGEPHMDSPRYKKRRGGSLRRISSREQEKGLPTCRGKKNEKSEKSFKEGRRKKTLRPSLLPEKKGSGHNPGFWLKEEKKREVGGASTIRKEKKKETSRARGELALIQ